MAIDTSDYQACLARIAARGKINPKEAEDLLEAVSTKADEMRRTGVDDPFNSAVWGLVNDLRDNAARKKQLAAESAVRRIEILNEAVPDPNKFNAKEAINTIRGMLYNLAGVGKINVQSLWRGNSDRWISSLFSKLKAEGLVDVAKSPDAFQQIANEIMELRGVGPTRPNATPFRRAAELIVESQEAQRALLNGVGSRIKQASDYIATMMHDSYLLRYGGRSNTNLKDPGEAFQRWADFIRDKLDDKTFEDVPTADRDNFLKDVWTAIYTGRHNHVGEEGLKGFEAGGYNIAKKLSEGRTLIFKDADSFASYNKEYGRFDNMLNLLLHTTDSNARRYALMRIFGPNPANQLQQVLTNLVDRYKTQDPDGVQILRDGGKGVIEADVREVMKLLDGTAERPANQMAARIGRTLRNATNMGFLGGVQLTHFASLFATISSDALMHGENPMFALGNMMRSLVSSMKAPDRADALADMGAFANGLKRHIEDHFGHGVTFDGVTSRINSAFMTGTGLPYIFEHVQAGHMEWLGARYARSIDKPFTDLHPAEQKLLNAYKIGPDEWSLLKTGEMNDGGYGYKILTPNVAGSIDRTGIVNLLRSRSVIKDGMSATAVEQAIGQFRSDLSDRLTMLYRDAAHFSVVGGGVREQSILNMGATPGTLKAEILGAVVQFHHWPLASIFQILARQYYDSVSKGRAVFNMGIIAGLSALGGYLRSTVRDLSNGLPPQQPRTVGEAGAQLLHYMAEGGALGLLGDWAFGEIARAPSVGSVAAGLGGPLFGTAMGAGQVAMTEIQKLLSATDKKVDQWPHVVRQIAPHVPFANLIYLRGGMNYLLNWHLYHAMEPQWWTRSNQMMQKEQGRTHFGFRPYSAPPYSPF